MGLDSYLKNLAAAVTGQSSPAPQQSTGAAMPPATAPSGGFMQGATNLISNPLVQAALGGYFSAAGSPRLAGVGGRISAGGLGALGGFNSAEAAQQKQQQQQ